MRVNYEFVGLTEEVGLTSLCCGSQQNAQVGRPGREADPLPPRSAQVKDGGGGGFLKTQKKPLGSLKKKKKKKQAVL